MVDEHPSPVVDGDSPLTTIASFAGNVDVTVDVIAFISGGPTLGTFSINGIPAGATIRRAWLQITSFARVPGEEVAVDFEGIVVGPRPADVVDEALVPIVQETLFNSLYRFDVTPFIVGNGDYSYFADGHSNAFGDSLIVVYEHPGLPEKTIVVNDGAEALRQARTTSSFAGLPAGAGRVILFTEADDPFTALGERVRLNGDTIAGPGGVFEANRGAFASLLEIPVSTALGTNTLEIRTGEDLFGAHLAILCANGLPPECFLVLGDGAGTESFDAGGHVWTTQLTGITQSYPVTLVDIPVFEVPVGSKIRTRLPSSVGELAVQVLMWNPSRFPLNPEQFTGVLLVTLWSDGSVTAVPYGDEDGMTITLETSTLDGERYVRFPFTIEGF